MLALTGAALALGCDRNEPPDSRTRFDKVSEEWHKQSQPAAGAPVRFTDVTADSGIDLHVTSGRWPWTQIVEIKGGGVGLIDYDSDGLLDVFIPNGATMDAPEQGPGCRLYRNLGSLRFQDVTAEAGLSFNRWGVGVAVGDYDGDGHDDLYITCLGRDALWHNTGQGRFEDVTEAAGLGDPRWSTAAAFGDLDGDGDLDLYVANDLSLDMEHPPPPEIFHGVEVPTGPRSLRPEPDVLYENVGGGTFRDVTEASGCAAARAAYGLGVVILDFDDDGRPDIFVGNDSMPNNLFMNQGQMRFDERGVGLGIATNSYGDPQATMGIAVADVDGNGRPDVFTTNFAQDTNTLHLCDEGGHFVDITHRTGLGMPSYPFVGWACGFYDLNHDGSEDVLVFNGHTYPGATREVMGSSFLQTPLLFVRDGRRFESVEAEVAGPWLAEEHCDRGAAFGDLDADGDIDVVVVDLRGPVRVLRNDIGGPNWLIVEPSGQPLGCRVDLTAQGQTQRRWIYSGGSFISASAQYAHFGLGEGVESVDLLVRWPDGHERRLEQVRVGQHLRVERE